MNVLIDENLPLKFTKLLEIVGNDNHGYFHSSTLEIRGIPDKEWIMGLQGKREGKWIIITQDRNIKRNPNERKAWKKSGHIMFFLVRSWQSIPLYQQCLKFLTAWPHIETQGNRASPGDEFRVKQNGKLEKVLD